MNFDDMKFALEAMTGGKNTIILDDLGLPSVMVAIPKMKNSEIISGGSDVVHPAFKVNNVEKDVVYFSKYQNIVMRDRGYSLPFKNPAVSMDTDAALTYCRNKGTGWTLTPLSLWAAVALWTRKNSTMPKGNNDFGKDKTNSWEKGVPIGNLDNGKVAHIATGSGPASWFHDGTPAGIADMNGNVWEKLSGMRLNNGEIQIIKDDDMFLATIDHSDTSADWKAIKSDGSLVAPGTSGSLKYDWVSSKIQLTTSITTQADSGRGCEYKDMTLASGLSAPELAKALIIYPDAPAGDYGGDYHWMNNSGERLPIAGGDWNDGADAGVFDLNLHDPRSNASWYIGFRAAYCDL